MCGVVREKWARCPTPHNAKGQNMSNRHVYYWYSPRGFANEGEVLRAPSPSHPRIRELFRRRESDPDMRIYRITRAEALETISRWRKELRLARCGKSAETVFGPTDFTDVAEDSED